MDSMWVGGVGDTGLHERTPYWMNGVVPLAALLEKAGGKNVRPGKIGIYQQKEWGPDWDLSGSEVTGLDQLEPVDVLEQALDYVNAALEYQNNKTGGIGPGRPFVPGPLFLPRCTDRHFCPCPVLSPFPPTSQPSPKQVRHFYPALPPLKNTFKKTPPADPSTIGQSLI